MGRNPPRTRMRGPARRAVITAAALELFAGIRESRAQAVTSLLADDMRAMGVDPREPIAEAMVELIITGLDGVAQWWERNPDMPRSLLVEGVARLLWNGLGRPR